MPRTIVAVLAAAMLLGWYLWAGVDAAGQQAPAAGAAGAAAASSPPGAASEAQQVSQQQLQQYVQALNEIARSDPSVATALSRGDFVDVAVIRPEPQADQALRQAGLSRDQARQITRQLQGSTSLKEQYRQVVQQTAQAQPSGTAGAAARPSPAAGTSGAAPASSGAGATTASSPVAGPGAEPAKSPKGE
jgi:hypothetical protein